ncbi:hypothetical protein SBADM41S_05390 [Streptomyces badius]
MPTYWGPVVGGPAWRAGGAVRVEPAGPRVGQGAYDAALRAAAVRRGVGGGRAPVQRAAGGGAVRAHRCGGGRRDAYAVEVHGAGVAATGLVRAGRLHGGGRLDLLRGNLRLGLHRAVAGDGRLRRRRLREGLALRGGGAACGSLQAPWEVGISRRSSSSGVCSEGSRKAGASGAGMPGCSTMPAFSGSPSPGIWPVSVMRTPRPSSSAPSALRPGR